jgi:hypothetical protein
MNSLDCEEEEPSIETIKKFADEKRKTIKKVNPELYEAQQQKRLDNLAKGRETRRLKLLEKNEKVVEEADNYSDIDKPFKGDLIGLYQYLKKKDDAEKEKEKEFDTLFKEITNIKEIITKPKAKSKPKPKSKPKIIGKSLDLTISDKEVEEIVNENKTQLKPIDPKLNAFLEALQKK